MADITVMINSGDSYDFHSLLSSSEGGFLVRNNNDQVKIDTLKGKKLGLYFSASWCGPCQRFTPILVEVYNEISPKGDFEIIFVSGDVNEESFNEYFSKMPWLAIPFSDSETRDRLDALFKVEGIPHLVILDDSGKVMCNDGVEIIREYGVEGYPFTPERIKEIKEKEEAARRNQSLNSVLVSRSRDFVISSDGKKVPVSELEGKTVGLYFSFSIFKSCVDFTAKLVDVYEKLKAKGDSFEIVLISLNDEEEPFKQAFGSMPWLALPFMDKSCEKLVRYFELSTVPTLVIIGPDGKTVHSNVAEAIEEHGILAYPFTPEKFAELAEIEKARQEAQTLESVLVSGDRDFVIGKDGAKISVSDLVGKNILLYFSAHWCYPCRAFLPKLIKAYHKIKAKNDAFEVIFISIDRDQASFNIFFAGMPWLALPFGDKRKASLIRVFKVSDIPTLVALGPTGRTVTEDARDLIMIHGADAYPFTDEHLKEIEAQYEEMAKGWPKKVKHALHEEHELVLTRRRSYKCNGCDEKGQVWSFYCEECDFDLHPKCALEEDKATKDDAKGKEIPKEGWICDGEVCFKAQSSPSSTSVVPTSPTAKPEPTFPTKTTPTSTLVITSPAKTAPTSTAVTTSSVPRAPTTTIIPSTTVPATMTRVPIPTPWVTTIAGENKGAFMEVLQFPKIHDFEGNPHDLHKKGSDGSEWHSHSSSSGEEGSSKMKDKSHNAKALPSLPMRAFMNSNVQGVNNSIVCDSSCTHHDPGVHVAL